jgi:hypothetical protein
MRGQTTSQAPNQGRNGGAGTLLGPQSLYNLLPAAGQTQPEAVSGAEGKERKWVRVKEGLMSQHVWNVSSVFHSIRN